MSHTVRPMLAHKEVVNIHSHIHSKNYHKAYERRKKAIVQLKANIPASAVHEAMGVCARKAAGEMMEEDVH